MKNCSFDRTCIDNTYVVWNSPRGKGRLHVKEVQVEQRKYYIIRCELENIKMVKGLCSLYRSYRVSQLWEFGNATRAKPRTSDTPSLRPMKSFYHWNPKLLGLGWQIRKMNLWHFGYFRPNYQHSFW